jgi:hypothetical protein
MAAKSEYPLLAVRPLEDKSGWYVEAWWTNRPSENIGHFATQSEARHWITLELTSYFCTSRDRINDQAHRTNDKLISEAEAGLTR